MTRLHLMTCSLLTLSACAGANLPAVEGRSPSAADALPPRLFSDSETRNCGGAEGIGELAPETSLLTPAGQRVSVADYRGRVVLLNFWGTWCAPCLEELPEFSRLYAQYRGAGLTLVAIATDEDPQAVDRVAEELEIGGKLLYGGESLAAQYGDRSFPFSMVVAPDGSIIEAYDGYDPRCLGHLESEVREQLAAL